MKKLLISSLFLSTMAFAQNGKVGINTSTPTETLNVNGTLRINTLPVSGTANSIYTKPDGTGSAAIDQTFNGSRVLMADDNGVVGVTATPGQPPVSQSKCVYGNSRYVFNNGIAAQIDFPNYSFAWKNDNGALSASGNEMLMRNNMASSDYVFLQPLGGTDPTITTSPTLKPGIWMHIGNNINWDAEATGEFLVSTGSNNAYRIIFWSHKYNSTSVPSFCWIITKVN